MKKLTTLLGSLLNIQILCEKLAEHNVSAALIGTEHQPAINGIQFYEEGIELSKHYIYLSTNETLKKLPPETAHISFVIFGEPDKESVHYDCSYIVVPKTENMYSLANRIQQIIIEYFELEKKLNKILYEDGSLYDICVLGVEHFKNPVFIHDEYYNILACPQFIEGVTNFTYNEQTNKYMQDAETLNNFRTSTAYKTTLQTTGGQLWDSDYDDNKSLYANIRIDDTYKGRFIVIDAISPFKPGQLHEVAYFAGIVRQALMMCYTKSGVEINSLQNFIGNSVNGIEINYGLLEKKLSDIGWNQDDRYVCGVISFESEEVTRLSIFVICNDIQNHIKGSFACYIKNSIYVLINLSIKNLPLSELRMKMSYIIREGLLHIGVSNEFSKITDFPAHIRQAEVALRFAKEHKLTSWYNEFCDCVLEYWMTKGLGEFTKETITSSAVSLLQSYDEAHGTDLYLTLETYLLYERNSTLTARILKVHRSTLPHRLERIFQLTQLNLDDFKTRLYLLMSFAILDNQDK